MLHSISRIRKPSLSDKTYIMEVSQPEKDWDARNLLSSLTFNIGNNMYIYTYGSSQKQPVYDDVRTLCRMFYEENLDGGPNSEYELSHHKGADPDYEDGDEEEEGEEEEEEGEEEEEEEVLVVEDQKKEVKKKRENKEQ